MNKSELFKAAHKLVKSVIKVGDNYRVTFGAAIKAILENLTAQTKVFVIEYSNTWTNESYKDEVTASNMKEAAENFIKINKRKFMHIYEKPTQEIKEVAYVEDAEEYLYQMDLKNVDSLNFKGHNRKSATVTRKQCEDYIAYVHAKSQVKRFSCRQALA